jgi:hypothetical protein
MFSKKQAQICAEGCEGAQLFYNLVYACLALACHAQMACLGLSVFNVHI